MKGEKVVKCEKRLKVLITLVVWGCLVVDVES